MDDSRESGAYEDFHLLVQAVVHDQRVGHPYPRRFHGMDWICQQEDGQLRAQSQRESSTESSETERD